MPRQPRAVTAELMTSVDAVRHTRGLPEWGGCLSRRAAEETLALRRSDQNLALLRKPAGIKGAYRRVRVR